MTTEGMDPAMWALSQQPSNVSVPPTPADHAAKGFVEWALADGRPNAEWVITRAEARALAARVDELERYCETQDWHTEWYVPMRQRAERAEAALRELVRLKDGPRHDAYRAAKETAWDVARAALGEQPEDRA